MYESTRCISKVKPSNFCFLFVLFFKFLGFYGDYKNSSFSHYELLRGLRKLRMGFYGDYEKKKTGFQRIPKKTLKNWLFNSLGILKKKKLTCGGFHLFFVEDSIGFYGILREKKPILGISAALPRPKNFKTEHPKIFQ